MPVDLSVLHPFISALIQTQNMRERQREFDARQKLDEEEFKERQKQNKEILDLKKKEMELEKTDREYRDKKTMFDLEQTLRGGYATGVRDLDRAPNVVPGTPEELINASALRDVTVNTPFGPMDLSGVRDFRDIELARREAFKADTPLVADRAGAVTLAQTDAQIPKLLAQLRIQSEENALNRQSRESIAAQSAEARKYAADKAFNGRLYAADKTAATRLSTVGAGKTDSRADRYVLAHDSHELTKRYAKAKEAEHFVKNIDPDSGNPADNIGLIYAFAKAMDPDSAVREGEYQTIQKYSQSWLQKFGFNAMRVLENQEFLAPQSVRFMQQTIKERTKSTEQLYKGYRKSVTSRIDSLYGEPGVGDKILGDVYSDEAPTSPKTRVKWGEDAAGNPVRLTK